MSRYCRVKYEYVMSRYDMAKYESVGQTASHQQQDEVGVRLRRNGGEVDPPVQLTCVTVY